MIESFKERVNKYMPVNEVILFSSRAVGKSTKDSDVDIIIVSPSFKNMNFFQRGAKMYDYWDLDYPVDFLCYTPEEFEKLKNKISIVREALSTGIVIK